VYLPPEDVPEIGSKHEVGKDIINIDKCTYGILRIVYSSGLQEMQEVFHVNVNLGLICLG
jgi:hypothetical protein